MCAGYSFAGPVGASYCQLTHDSTYADHEADPMAWDEFLAIPLAVRGVITQNRVFVRVSHVPSTLSAPAGRSSSLLDVHAPTG